MLSLYQDYYNPALLRKLLKSSEWPKAIDEQLLEPKDKIQRAHSILNLMVGPHLLQQAKSILDFGCGTGETIRVAPEYGISNSVGYDVQPAEGVVTKFSEVKAKGPYDIIIVNDVLDHLIDETVHVAMGKIASVINPEGTIFIRCHPYCSRAGTHLPAYGINKAYAHIFFPELKGEPTNFIYHPVVNYRKVFENHQLEIEQELIHRQEVESFFKENEQMWYVMQKTLKSKEFLWHLRLQYAEFTLRNPRVA